MVNICPPGYFGSLCRAKCIYPSYGKECKEVCDCSEDLCNVTTGCQGMFCKLLFSLLISKEVFHKAEDYLKMFSLPL